MRFRQYSKDFLISFSISLILGVLVLVFLAVPESQIPYDIFILQNGQEVHCRYATYSPCGISLQSCNDNAVYSCQTNVKKLK